MAVQAYATGMDEGGSRPPSPRETAASSSTTSAESVPPVPGALPPELISMLIPRTVNEDGELQEEPPPSQRPSTLAPAFSKENLDALRAERQARRIAASAAPLATLESGRATVVDPQPKAAKSHRSSSSNSPTPSESSRKPRSQKSKRGQETVYLAMSYRAKATAEPESPPLRGVQFAEGTALV